jgi:hypothetical protein
MVATPCDVVGVRGMAYCPYPDVRKIAKCKNWSDQLEIADEQPTKNPP